MHHPLTSNHQMFSSVFDMRHCFRFPVHTSLYINDTLKQALIQYYPQRRLLKDKSQMFFFFKWYKAHLQMQRICF